MPIYSYLCPKHGTVDVIVKSWRDQEEKIKCPIARGRKVCARVIELQPALVTMKPDKYWHTGRYVETLDQTFKSEKEYQGFLKQTGRQAAEPGDGIQAVRGKQKTEEKQAKIRHEHIVSTVKDFADAIPGD